MQENHNQEQYFFEPGTLEHLGDFLLGRGRVCCLCAPMLGKWLAENGGADVTILDIDERFADVPGFRKFDLNRLEYLDMRFDLIVCDPPFFNVGLRQLFAAVRAVGRFNYGQQMLVSYLERRREAFLHTFSPFGLEGTGYFPKYDTVQDTERNQIEFFGNLGPKAHAELFGGN